MAKWGDRTTIGIYVYSFFIYIYIKHFGKLEMCAIIKLFWIRTTLAVWFVLALPTIRDGEMKRSNHYRHLCL
ncbi:Hypothetical protein MAGa4020 [Mycoplasmopsis agalactiae]|uniref:Uncharacterized protein n=1 Tax=Mycoplasmopsis agalactiae TaxID=2110 RepID=D3VQM0_MYCAA|nr:Hypothetical protein MAGa4020 [Mycoplasmopsis agalactiae]